MADVARQHKRVVQTGTQQRSGPHYAKARELIKSGHIGPVTSVRMSATRNIMPGYGSPPDGTPPPELDYDMWLGPAPLRPYNPNRSIYHFRWFWDYSGGQMTNLAAHSIDILDWFLARRRSDRGDERRRAVLASLTTAKHPTHRTRSFSTRSSPRRGGIARPRTAKRKPAAHVFRGQGKPVGHAAGLNRDPGCANRSCTNRSHF